MTGQPETFHAVYTADVKRILQSFNWRWGACYPSRNLHPSEGLCNGTRMSVMEMGQRCIKVRLLEGDFDGQIKLIPRIVNELASTVKKAILSSCFAMTVNDRKGRP